MGKKTYTLQNEHCEPKVMEVWKMIFLFNWMIFRGCNCWIYNHCHGLVDELSKSFFRGDFRRVLSLWKFDGGDFEANSHQPIPFPNPSPSPKPPFCFKFNISTTSLQSPSNPMPLATHLSVAKFDGSYQKSGFEGLLAMSHCPGSD